MKTDLFVPDCWGGFHYLRTRTDTGCLYERISRKTILTKSQRRPFFRAGAKTSFYIESTLLLVSVSLMSESDPVKSYIKVVRKLTVGLMDDI